VEEQDYATTYRLEEGNWWFVGMRRICLEWVDRCRGRRPAGPGATGRGPDRILDVGCGTGINLDPLAERGRAVGVDLSATALAFCRRRGLGGLVQGRGECLPFPDGSFDVVSAIGVVEHIEADAAAVAEWARVLAPGGDLVLLTSAYRWLWSGHDLSNHHVRRYTAAEVRALLEGAGLEGARVSYVNCFLLPPIVAVRAVAALGRRLRGRPALVAHKDTGEVPGPVNRLLVALLAVEARLLRRVDLPFGVSMVASARKAAMAPAPAPLAAGAAGPVTSGTSSG
jgi:SAM-dependent methyltransferase